MRTVTAVCALAVDATPVVTTVAKSAAAKRVALDIPFNPVIIPPPLFVVVEIIETD